MRIGLILSLTRAKQDWFIAIGFAAKDNLPTVPLAVINVVFVGYNLLLQLFKPSSVIYFSVFKVNGMPTSLGVKNGIFPFQNDDSEVLGVPPLAIEIIEVNGT